MNIEPKNLLGDFVECYVRSVWTKFGSYQMGICPYCLESVVFSWGSFHEGEGEILICRNCHEKSKENGRALNGERKIKKFVEQL